MPPHRIFLTFILNACILQGAGHDHPAKNDFYGKECSMHRRPDAALMVAAAFTVVLAQTLLAQSGTPGYPLSNNAYSLVHKPVPGATGSYRITRLDETVDSEGRITSRARSTGLFIRQALFVNDDGTWTDRYTWKSFSTGRTEGAADSIPQAAVSAVQGFVYDIASTDRLSLPPIGVGGLAKTPETFAFFVLAWDAATFVHTVAATPSYPLHRINRIGDQVTETAGRLAAQFDFTPVVSSFSYARRPMTTAFAGLSLAGRIPCGMLRFEAPANPIAYVFSTDRQQIQVKGAEWISGATLVSLEDASLVAGEMQNTMIAAQTVTMPGKTIQAPFIVRQHITLDRVSEGASE
jgi:hypothetical protein